MSRASLALRLLVAEATVKAARAALRAEGELEHTENRSVPTWRMSFATVAGSETRDHAEVTDPKAFLGYLIGRYPTEVTQRTVTEVRNPEWLAQLLDRLAVAGPVNEAGDVTDDEHTVIPGVKFVPGGRFVTVSVTPKPPARVRLAKAARRAVETGDWSEIDAILEGRVDLAVEPAAPLDDYVKRG